jgi:hypothetical protein
MTKEYYDGVLEGLFRYAWMKDGVYYVGSCGSTLKEAQSDVENERAADKGSHGQQSGKTPAQQPQPAMCLGCEYWRIPSVGHCMRGEGVEFCFKVGTHAGVR